MLQQDAADDRPHNNSHHQHRPDDSDQFGTVDISRILRGKLSLTVMPVDLSAVIAEALETVRLAAEAKAIQIYTMLSPGICLVIGDAGRLQQVMAIAAGFQKHIAKPIEPNQLAFVVAALAGHTQNP